jgi:PAS domain S-box-containing protein
MNHNSVSFPNLSPGDPASASAYSDPANEYVSGTNDAAAQALRTNSRNPRSEIGTGLLDWMGRAFGDAVERANYPLARLLQALPAAIYATDAVGRITFYNDAAAKLWGCRPELGKSEFCGSWKLYWPDGRPMAHHQCPMAVALREQREIRGLEAMAERPDGSFVQFMPYPTPLFDSTGVLIGAVNMLVDISDRKRADIHAQQLASIVETSNDAIVSKDLNGIITSWNGGAERLFGYTVAEVLGKPVTLLIPPDRRAEEPEILERIRRGERVGCRQSGAGAFPTTTWRAHHSRWSRPSVVGLEQGSHDCDGGPRACHQRRQTWCSVEW